MAFVTSLKLGGVLFSTAPFLVVVFGSLGWANSYIGDRANHLEGETSSYIEQILCSVRIVQSFGMGPSLIERLERDWLKPSQQSPRP